MSEHNIFISWSGARSKAIAECLKRWLPKVVNAARPFVSTQDIRAGARWGVDVGRALDRCTFGVLCLTPENLTEPWILFEAGAMAKVFDVGRVCPVLLEGSLANLPEPLSQFQGVMLEREPVTALVLSICETLDAGIPEPDVREAVDVWWPQLERCLREVPEATELAIVKTDRQLLEEVLETVRANSSSQAAQLRFTAQFPHRALEDQAYRSVRSHLLHPRPKDDVLDSCQQYLFATHPQESWFPRESVQDLSPATRLLLLRALAQEIERGMEREGFSPPAGEEDADS